MIIPALLWLSQPRYNAQDFAEFSVNVTVCFTTLSYKHSSIIYCGTSKTLLNLFVCYSKTLFVLFMEHKESPHWSIVSRNRLIKILKMRYAEHITSYLVYRSLNNLTIIFFNMIFINELYHTVKWVFFNTLGSLGSVADKVQCNSLIWNGSGPPLYPEKWYKRDSPIPIPIHTQESGPGDRAIYADIPSIWTTL